MKFLLVILFISSFASPSKGEENPLLFPIKKSGRWGFMNQKGKVVIPPAFDEVFNFSEGLAAVVNQKRLGFINSKGIVVIPLEFEAYWGDDGYAWSLKKSKLTKVNVRFSENVAAVRLRGKMGFIDPAGNWVIPNTFDFASFFSEGIAVVANKSQNNSQSFDYFFINHTGNKAVEKIYEEIYTNFSGGYCIGPDKRHRGSGWVSLGGEYDMCDSSDCDGFSIGEFSEGLSSFVGTFSAKGSNLEDPNHQLSEGYMNVLMKTQIPLNENYDSLGDFHEGLAWVCKYSHNGADFHFKYGYIDSQGKETIPLIYSGAGNFSGGLAPAAIGKKKGNLKWGYINDEGKMVIPFQFDKAEEFRNGLAQVHLGAQVRYIDKNGKYIRSPLK